MTDLRDVLTAWDTRAVSSRELRDALQAAVDRIDAALELTRGITHVPSVELRRILGEENP